ncbi:MAG: hypothetical protein JXR96_25885, partial [Deltaproteobacteria bacterium]|nr:hypothetical protein [Deltaproteobacteria bacterium]
DYASCDSGYRNCDSNRSNGCEQYLWSTDSCGTGCTGRVNCYSQVQHANNETCNSGTCDYSTCDTNYGDCDSVRSNGCETDLRATTTCGSDCSSLHNCYNDVVHATGEYCNGGNCDYTSCDTGYANCNSNRRDGCETQLGTVFNCTGCGDACDANEVCNGSCQCATGWSDCDGLSSNGCECNTGGSYVCYNNACCLPATCGANSCGEIDDGCGGTVDCGSCSDPQETCNASHQCVCLNTECNNDCCASGQVCDGRNQCCTRTTCLAGGYECGSPPDGCDGNLSCGTCSGANETCDGSYQCVCQYNECNSVCCDSGQVCHSGTGDCCTPDTCGGGGYECGSPSNGCGGDLACGTCSANETCNGSYQCECLYNECNSVCCSSGQICHDSTGACCTADTCIGEGYECDSPPNGCGGNLSCGTCSANETCNGSYQCVCKYEECSSVCCDSGQVCDMLNACCTPNCGARICGPDPACDSSCGTCGAHAICAIGGLSCNCDSGYSNCDGDLSCECNDSTSYCEETTCCPNGFADCDDSGDCECDLSSHVCNGNNCM